MDGEMLVAASGHYGLDVCLRKLKKFCVCPAVMSQMLKCIHFRMFCFRVFLWDPFYLLTQIFEHDDHASMALQRVNAMPRKKESIEFLFL